MAGHGNNLENGQRLVSNDHLGWGVSAGPNMMNILGWGASAGPNMMNTMRETKGDKARVGLCIADWANTIREEAQRTTSCTAAREPGLDRTCVETCQSGMNENLAHLFRY